MIQVDVSACFSSESFKTVGGETGSAQEKRLQHIPRLGQLWVQEISAICNGRHSKVQKQGLEDVNIVVIDVGLAEPLGKRSK